MTQVYDVGTVCASCGEPAAGRYCARCGEEALDPHSLTVRHFVTHTVAHEMLHVDGKVWRTVRGLLLRPGFLTAEFFAGRRRLYVNPVRLLVVAIIVYAVATRGGLVVSLKIGRLNLSIAPARTAEGVTLAETMKPLDRFGVLQRIVNAKAQSVDLTSETTRERFHKRLEAFAEPLSFTNVVLLALAFYALFHRRRPLLVEHAVFSMHFLSFVLLSSLADISVMWLLRDQRPFVNHELDARIVAVTAIIVGVITWQFAYLTMAIRRFYVGSRLGRAAGVFVSAAAAFLIYMLNSVFMTGIQMLGGALALWAL